MKSNYKVIWTESFRQDYSHEYEYSIEHWGQDHADGFFDELDQKIIALSELPHSNLHKPEMPQNSRCASIMS